MSLFRVIIYTHVVCNVVVVLLLILLPYEHRHSHYVRDYTGYMALHTALTTDHGSVWKFDNNMKLVEVLEDHGQADHQQG